MAAYQWADLDGEGLSGILSPADGAWYYKRNLSAANLVAQPDGTVAARASFGPLETVTHLPSRSDLAGVRLLDLSGGGHLDVVDLAGPDPGFFERTEDATFEPLQRFAALPALDWSDPNLTFIDLTGDGLADILMTEDGLFTVYASLGGDAGFDSPLQTRPGWDEEKGPSVVLSDGTQTIFTADMSGDGLSDIVRIRNGEACYWPNQGYGRFGAKVTMDLAPRFDNEERFDPAPDQAGRHRRLRHRRPALRRRGRRDHLVQPVGQRLVGTDAHRGVPRRGPAQHGPGPRPAGHRNGLPGLVLAAARRDRGTAALRRPDGRPEAAPDDRRPQQPRRRDPRHLRAVHPLLRRRRDRRHARGSPGCRFPSRWSSASRRSTGSAGTGWSPATPTTTATSTATSASSAASAWSSSGTPRSSAPTPTSPTVSSPTGTSSPGRRRC